MDCKEISSLLYDYTRGETGMKISETIKDHLGACPECAAELNKIMELKGIFRASLAEVPVNSIVKIREHMKKPAIFRLFFKPVFAAAAVLLITGTLLINSAVSYARSSELDSFLSDSYKVVDHSDCYDVITAGYSGDIEQDIY